LDDPEHYFRRLKAQIKLKAVKKYQEDKDKREEEERKLAEPIVIVRDKFGRVMEKKDPLMATKKKPSQRRPPKKRAPPKRKISFTAD
jgi:hypothetical protein